LAAGYLDAFHADGYTKHCVTVSGKRIMAKVTFEFDYYEDRDEIDMLVHMKDAYGALWEIDKYVRDKMKHDEVITPEQDLFYKNLRALCADPLQHYC
jgi:hypothetical protein